MKTKLIMALSIFCILLMAVKPFSLESSVILVEAQESKLTGVYDGNEGYGYNFITQQKDGGSEFTMTFKNVSDAVLKEFDLSDKLFLNKKFEVSYTMETVVSKDEDGFDQEDDVYTITHLKAL